MYNICRRSLVEIAFSLLIIKKNVNYQSIAVDDPLYLSHVSSEMWVECQPLYQE